MYSGKYEDQKIWDAFVNRNNKENNDKLDEQKRPVPAMLKRIGQDYDNIGKSISQTEDDLEDLMEVLQDQIQNKDEMDLYEAMIYNEMMDWLRQIKDTYEDFMSKFGSNIDIIRTNYLENRKQ